MTNCPGCHFRCDLTHPNCGKGMRLAHELQENGYTDMKRDHLAMLYGSLLDGPLSSIEHFKLSDTCAALVWIDRFEGAMTQRTLCARMPQCTTELLQSIVDQGLARAETIHDTTYYTLTLEGRDYMRSEQQLHNQAVDRVFGMLDDQEIETLIYLNHRIMDACR